MNKPSPELQSAMRDSRAARQTDPDKLDRLRGHLRRLRDLRAEKADLEERLRSANVAINEMCYRTLVDAFDECGAESMGLLAEGNNPPFDVRVEPYYKANISAEWDQKRRDVAFAYLKSAGAGDLPRAVYTIGFGKDTERAQRAFEQLLRKNKIEFTRDLSVPWNTLTSWVKEMIVDHGKMPKLDLIGATVGRVAVVAKPKKEK